MEGQQFGQRALQLEIVAALDVQRDDVHPVTRENVGKRMAILLFEKGKGEVVTAPVIRSEIGGGRVQISGRMSTGGAHATSLLLRVRSLAGPLEIPQEATPCPAPGAGTPQQSFDTVHWCVGVGRGGGPASRAPVRLAVSTISLVDWSSTR